MPVGYAEARNIVFHELGSGVRWSSHENLVEDETDGRSSAGTSAVRVPARCRMATRTRNTFGIRIAQVAFSACVDAARDSHRCVHECEAMKPLNTRVKHLWDFSIWFVFMSPVLGALLGFVSLLIFAR